MKHQIIGRELNRSPSHRRMLLRTMVTQLFKHEMIITTAAKAKELRRFAEPMVTLAKKGTLHARRQALAYITEPAIVDKLFQEYAVRYKSRPGGYTAVKKLSQRRKGDCAEMAYICLVDGPKYLRPRRHVSNIEDLNWEEVGARARAAAEPPHQEPGSRVVENETQ